MAIKLRSLVFIVILFGVLLFAAVNWAAFVERQPINLLVTTVMAPLGLIMLGVLAGLSVLYLLFLAKVETESLVGGRRANKEVEEARKLALNAEESRITALREDMRQGLESVDRKVDEILRRVDAQGRLAVRHETTVAPDRLIAKDEELL